MKQVLALATSILLICMANQAIATESAPPASSSNIQPLVSGQRVRVKKLTKDINANRKSLITTGPSTFQSASELNARKKRFQQFTDAINRYPQIDDPDVQSARKAYLALRTEFSSEFARAKEQLATLGNVQERLKLIQTNMQQYPVPQSMQLPFTEAQASEWVKKAGNARTVAENSIKQLQQIAPIAYLPATNGTPESGSPFDASDTLRMHGNAQQMLKSIGQNYNGMNNELSTRMTDIEQTLKARWTEAGDGEKSWIFTGEGKEEEAFKYFSESQAISLSSQYLLVAVGQKAEVATTLQAKIEAKKSEFLQKKELAVSSARLPKPVSEDSQMLEYAQTILDNPKYKFGEYGPIVLTTSEIVDRERKDSEVEIDDAEVSLSGDLKLSGTETTWTYRWQEFKFATALKDTDQTWYIWWITAKNFSSGGDRTPLNRWVSGKATKGSPILEKNIR